MPSFDLSEQTANTIYAISNIVVLVASVVGVAGAIGIFWAGGIRDKFTAIRELQTQEKIAEANKIAALANEGQAKANKLAEEARLELAKIDPLNLPIKSLRADVFLFVRGQFYYEQYFPNGIMAKGDVSVSLHGANGALVILRCKEFESVPLSSPKNESGPMNPDGYSFSMSFVWPSSNWLEAEDAVRFWVDRKNASTRMLDEELVAAIISMPPTKGDAEILQASCVLTINGSIRREFSVPTTFDKMLIVCPPKKN